MREILDARSINYHSVSSRTKTTDSYERKASEDKYAEPEKEIMDMTGVRAITYTQTEAKSVANLVKDLFNIMPEHSMDKTEELGTDRVGYRSIHFVGTLGESRQKLPEDQIFVDLCFEIQVRTIL